MKLLVAYDGSDTSRVAISLAKKHAKVFGAKVIITTSIVKGTEDKLDQIKISEKNLEDKKLSFMDDGIECETALLIRGLGHGEDIVRFAREEQVDEIVIGIRRRSKTGKIIFGSTAQFVILNAHCPVLTVK
jgi:nucleotide-binding universal stress UspA family protein